MFSIFVLIPNDNCNTIRSVQCVGKKEDLGSCHKGSASPESGKRVRLFGPQMSDEADEGDGGQ